MIIPELTTVNVILFKIPDFVGPAGHAIEVKRTVLILSGGNVNIYTYENSRSYIISRPKVLQK